MEERIKGFLIKSLWVVIVLFIVRCIILMPETVYDFFGSAGEAISVAVILMFFYEKVLWKYNPLEKIPKLDKEYNGIIEYCYNGENGKKESDIYVKQSLLSVSIKIKTDEINSNSISADFILENNSYVLYYTYITSPKSKVGNKNPIQYGSCRLILDDNKELRGTYWTSSQTIGDMYLHKKIKA